MTVGESMQQKYKYVTDELLQIDGVLNDGVLFVLKEQLKNKTFWQKFAQPFVTKEDTKNDNEGWRGEYFGKQMRGAVWCYRYCKDEELYQILTDAAKLMLTTQEDSGRFSSYEQDKEFCGWDMWSRKYIITGFLHYYSICKDDALKAQILSALCRHLDYIVAHIGKGEGQKHITDTSSWWGAVNSCTILEPVVEMYKFTQNPAYLAFAEYIIEAGGCSEGNLVELAYQNQLYPYQYPVVKAYEMMSFYEGLLAYYEVSGNEKYLTVVNNFVTAVKNSDITIIGCAGCTHELFDNSTLKQTEYSQTIMQETCVTVTWMRLLSRLYLLTGDKNLIDDIERSGFNALYGSMNTERNPQYSFERKTLVDAMAFDSYSPLYMNARGRGVGGYKEFVSGGYYGCCVAIAACGMGLMPLTAVMKAQKGYLVNMLFNGTLTGKDFTLQFASNYPAEGNGTVTVRCQKKTGVNLRFRKPDWCQTMTVNGKQIVENYSPEQTYHDGDIIAICYQMHLQTQQINGKIAATYGALVLAADSAKSTRDLQKPVQLSKESKYQLLPTQAGELVRLQIEQADGDNLLLSDYQSCGKKWLSDKPLITVWMNQK